MHKRGQAFFALYLAAAVFTGIALVSAFWPVAVTGRAVDGGAVCVNSCPVDNGCVVFGTRSGGNYCTLDGSMKAQQAINTKCENSYECSSNICASGQCVDAGFLEKFIEVFRKLLGGQDNVVRKAFPQTRGEYVLEGEPREETLCSKMEEYPDTARLGLRGEVCTRSLHGEYRNKDRNEGMFVIVVDITKGKELYEEVLGRTSVSGTSDSKPALFRIEKAELLWFSEKEHDLIVTQQFTYRKHEQGVSYDYQQSAEQQHVIVQELLKEYGIDAKAMEKVSEYFQQSGRSRAIAACAEERIRVGGNAGFMTNAAIDGSYHVLNVFAYEHAGERVTVLVRYGKDNREIVDSGNGKEYVLTKGESVLLSSGAWLTFEGIVKAEVNEFYDFVVRSPSCSSAGAGQGSVKGPSCTESDAGRDYDTFGVVNCGAALYPDQCFSPTIVREYYYDAGIDDWNEELHACEYGCDKGACKPKPAAQPVQQEAVEVLCEQESESDRGLNSVMPGEIFAPMSEAMKKGQEKPKVVAKDSCLNKQTLREYICVYVGEGKSVVQSVELTCPYGCENGGCVLGEKARVCFGERCIDLTQEMRCRDEGGWRGQTFVRGGVELYAEGKVGSREFGGKGSRATSLALDDECIDERTKRAFACTPFVQHPSMRDAYEIPTSTTVPCPAGYSCSEGKCLQEERRAAAGAGDLNTDGKLNDVDVKALKALLAQESILYSAKADVDGDGWIDSYDAYLLEGRVRGTVKEDVRHPIRELMLTSQNLLLSRENDLLGTLVESSSGQKTQWKIEHKQKGGSRSVCRPPVLNINLKDVKKSQRIMGLSSENPGGLRYDEFRLVPDCDIWKSYDADNLIREYFVHWLFRKFGVPAVDTIGFASVRFDTPQHASDFDIQKKYHYIILQRDNADKDQVPFMKQFNFARLIEASDHDITVVTELCKDKSENEVWGCNNEHRLSPLLAKKGDGSSERLEFDADTSIRYFVLNAFADVNDRGYLHNEDFGLDASSGKWKYIPFDFDSSFSCGISYNYFREQLEKSIANLPAQQRSEYQKKYYAIAREIFDNPSNLHEMLLTIERYPFRVNSIKMKNEIRARFYENALYYGSPAFAKSIGQEYKPFVHQSQYLKEAKRLGQLESYDSLCYNSPGSSLSGTLTLYQQA